MVTKVDPFCARLLRLLAGITMARFFNLAPVPLVVSSRTSLLLIHVLFCFKSLQLHPFFQGRLQLHQLLHASQIPTAQLQSFIQRLRRLRPMHRCLRRLPRARTCDAAALPALQQLGRAARAQDAAGGAGGRAPGGGAETAIGGECEGAMPREKGKRTRFVRCFRGIKVEPSYHHDMP